METNSRRIKPKSCAPIFQRNLIILFSQTSGEKTTFFVTNAHLTSTSPQTHGEQDQAKKELP